MKQLVCASLASIRSERIFEIARIHHWSEYTLTIVQGEQSDPNSPLNFSPNVGYTLRVHTDQGKKDTMRIVIKIGGGEGIDLAEVIADCVALSTHGHEIIVVHGCSAAVNQLSAELGVAVRHVTSPTGVRSRRTDSRDMAIFEMAAARVNSTIVREMQRLGMQACGVSGVDGGVLHARRKATIRVVEGERLMVIHDDFTGTVCSVNDALIIQLIQQGYTPIIAPVALAEDYTAVNVDGDRAAAAVATATNADHLIMLTNVPGVLRDLADPHSLIMRIEQRDIAELEASVSGGMRRKLMGARQALAGGVQQVILADGRQQQPIQAALAGRGTMLL